MRVRNVASIAVLAFTSLLLFVSQATAAWQMDPTYGSGGLLRLTSTHTEKSRYGFQVALGPTEITLLPGGVRRGAPIFSLDHSGSPIGNGVVGALDHGAILGSDSAGRLLFQGGRL
ncbi:MAG: hypothetical protein JHD16_00010 [Solirubrobacteraceae bacterium]|nr:hypothetical protein [Solirubrobacteraceae bacterium]